jgi:DNA-directed RNA polymerase subunit RPC12/RpoP
MRRLLVWFIAAVLLTAGFLMLVPTVKAVGPSIEVEDSTYDLAKIYGVHVPGETLNIKVTDATANKNYKIQIKIGTTEKANDTITTDAAGRKTYTYTIPDSSFMPDGGYTIDLIDLNTSATVDSTYMTVQKYFINMVPERTSYMPGEQVNVTYTVNLLKTGELASSGYGKRTAIGGNFTFLDETFTEASGKFTFLLAGQTQVGALHRASMWFNDTISGTTPIRSASSSFTFNAVNLGIGISADKSSYSPGDIVTLTITSNVPNTQINSIEVKTGVAFDQTLSKYSKSNLDVKTDSQGRAKYTFKLEDDATADDIYKVSVKSGSSDASTTFKIKQSSQIFSADIQSDKIEYRPGEKIKLTAIASLVKNNVVQKSTTNKYIYTIMNNAGSVLSQITTDKDTLEYEIPKTHIGTLTCSVSIFSSEGKYATDSITVSVPYAIIKLTAPDEFRAGDKIVVNYDIQSELMSSPTLYYKIKECGSGVATIVQQSINTTTKSGSFSFDIPTAPDSAYQITIYASEKGQIVDKTITIKKVTGYELSIKFQDQAVKPGDKTKISYTLSSREGKELKGPFTLMVGVSGATKTSTFVVDEPVGTITYTVPETLSDSAVLLTVSSSDSGGTPLNTVFTALQVKKSPAISDIMGSGAFDVTVLSISILAFIIGIVCVLKLFGIIKIGGARAVTGATPPHLPPTIPPQQPQTIPSGQQPTPQAVPPASQPQQPTTALPKVMVRCFKCGNDIEVTSTERPLVISCNKCGEKGMLT